MEQQNKKENKSSRLPHVVIPTIRSEEHFIDFWSAWEEEFKGCVIHVVFDMEEVPEWASQLEGDVITYCWKDIDDDLKDKAWIIPRRSDCVRSYGYYKAWQKNPLFIVTLDDDVKPLRSGHLQDFGRKLTKPVSATNPSWFNTMKHPDVPRGTPREDVEIGVVHGMWTNVADFDAKTQIDFLSSRTLSEGEYNVGIVPKGILYSMCGMNLAWRPELTKYMYFGLQGHEWPIDRCGDIWAGIHSKYNMDKYTDFVSYSGYPMCIHTRASNPWSNYKKEEPAEEMTKQFIKLFSSSKKLGVPKDFRNYDYWQKLLEAYEIWEELFNE